MSGVSDVLSEEPGEIEMRNVLSAQNKSKVLSSCPKPSITFLIFCMINWQLGKAYLTLRSRKVRMKTFREKKVILQFNLIIVAVENLGCI